MRQPYFVGTYYQKADNLLKKQIQECFEGQEGPGATPNTLGAGDAPLAVIAPHSPYSVAGPASAWSYKVIGDTQLADIYVILGTPLKTTNSGLTQSPFQTPFGIVRVDQDFARRLVEKGSIKENDAVFDQEPAIEVQLPFLQFSHMSQIEKIKILPIMVGDDLDLQKLSLDIQETIIESNKKVVFILPMDFTHYGTKYRYIPFSTDIQQKIADLDKGAIQKIQDVDFAGFAKYVDEKMATIYGEKAVELLLRTIKPQKVLLEQYYTSTVFTKDEKK